MSLKNINDMKYIALSLGYLLIAVVREMNEWL